jgi:hypothetical protein
MASTSVTLTISLSDKLVTQDGTLAIREHVQIKLVNLAGSAPADFTLALQNGDTVIASCAAFTASGDDAVGELLLSGASALALFDADEDAPLATKVLYLVLWDKTLKSLRVAENVTIYNNVYLETLTAPTAI